MVYLDYAATCPVVKYPQRLYRDVLGEGYFLNPNANYAYKEKRLLSEAENRVKKAIGAKSGKVVFGGTSSQLIENLMNVNHDYQVWCSPWEHDSFFRYADVNNIVSDLDELESWLKTALPSEVDDFYVSRPVVMWQAVQNITGEIFPAKQIGELVHKYNGFYICDGTAQIGHTPIEPNIDNWCDFWCCSGHKAGTELGIGCCWISDRLDKWLNGFKLHGTPNLAGALALVQAVENACNKKFLYERIWHFSDLANSLNYMLIESGIDYNFVPEYPDNDEPPFAYAINAIRLPGFNARALQSYLASKEIYIGLGQSSCADKANRRVLCQGYGLSKQEADEVIRISFGEDSNIEDVKALIDGIATFRKEYL